MQMICDTCEEAWPSKPQAVTDPQTGERFGIAICPSCDLGRTVPVPADLGSYYQAEYFGGRHGITERHCMRRRTGFLREVSQPGRLLDFGCGDGSFLLAAREAGWDVSGTEVKQEHARARGLTIAERVDQLPGDFDAITLWHSLEHVASPRQILSDLTARLVPGGHLLVAVPNRSSWQARLFGPNWFHYDVPRHVSHFTPGALQNALQSSGLQVVKTWHLEAEIDWFGWPQSALNSFMPTPNVLFDTVTRRKINHSKIETYASLVLGAGLTVLSAPLVPLAAAFGSGAIMIMAARKTA